MKLLLKIILMLFLTTTGYSQTANNFSHDIGLEVSNLITNSRTLIGGFSPGILYSPQLILSKSKVNFISLNSGISLGVNINSSAETASSLFHLGLTGGLNFNKIFGLKRDTESEDAIFIGGGYGLNTLALDLDSGEELTTSNGLFFNLGGRFDRFRISVFTILGLDYTTGGVRISRSIAPRIKDYWD